MRQGQASAFEEYVLAASPRLLRTAWYLCGDPSLAEELVQGALTRLYVVWPRITRFGEPPDGYVHKMLVNAHIDERRRRARESPSAQAADLAEARADGPRPLRAEHVDVVRALAALAPRERQVVTLRYLADLPERDVADLLGISVGTVKSSGSDGLRKLRATLGEDHVHVT